MIKYECDICGRECKQNDKFILPHKKELYATGGNPSRKLAYMGNVIEPKEMCLCDVCIRLLANFTDLLKENVFIDKLD